MLTAKRPQLRRLLIFDGEIRSGSHPTAERLAQLAEVAPRTVLRDLEILRDELGAPLEFCRRKNGWRYTCDTFQLPHLRISEGELVALFVAEQLLRHHRGTPYEEDLSRAVRKLALLLPDEITVHWDTVARSHSFRTSAVGRGDTETFRRLARAVLHRRQLRLVYWTASREEVTERRVDPWHLTNVDGEWFLVGYCHLRKCRRTFAPARIRELAETGRSFDVPEDFSAADLLEGTFKVVAEEDRPLQRIRLRFAPSAAKYIREKTFHPSQKSALEADGSLLLELSLRSFIEVRRWILSWGSECTVLEPAELRRDIAREAELIAEHYAAHSATRPHTAARGRTRTRTRTG
ncbi:MAG: WYL domain-containing protein [Planctomycetes bacterium]|nr:WYL domain-containing protein [Planctomycetota bacterium]